MGLGRALLRGRDRADRLPGLALLPAPARRTASSEARAHADDLLDVFGAENVYFEVQKNGLAPQEKCNEGIVKHRARGRRQPRRHGRRALPAPRGLRPPHGAAVRADQEHARRAEDDLRDQRVLPARQRRDDRERSPSGRRRSPATLEIAERCDVEIELGKQLIPRYPTPDGRDEPAYLRARVRGGAAPALRRPGAGRGGRADGDGARRDRPDGLQRLLPDRLGLRQVRQGERHRRRPGPRLGGRLDRRLLPARSPTSTRSSTTCCSSASSTPSACRCRTSTSTSRCAGGSSVMRYVTEKYGTRVGRADRHVRQDVPARGDPRRGARAGPRLRRRRPPGQADPRPDHGPLAVLRGLPEARGSRCAKACDEDASRQADRRRRPGPRGDRAQLLDPRRGGRDRRPSADRHRAAAAGRRRHRRERRRKSTARSRSSR